MRCYEHTFITKQDLSEGQAKSLLSKYEDIIKTNSGKVLKIEEWGLRNLAHRIKNNNTEKYLKRSIESVASQTVKPKELLIVISNNKKLKTTSVSW